MQLALTKKLAGAMGLAPEPATIGNPLFEWTANWTKVLEDDDLLVLVNSATRFAVAIHPVKRKDIKKVDAAMVVRAIRNTMLSHNLNEEVVDAYLKAAGEVRFAENRDRQLTAWVNRAGIDCANHLVFKYESIPDTLDDTLANYANMIPCSLPGKSEGKFEGISTPRDAMFEALSNLTGLPVYGYRAFEILVTLDLGTCSATRRLIVPSAISFAALHRLLQTVFGWHDSHMHEFRVLGEDRITVATLVMDEDDLGQSENAVLENGHSLSQYFPQFNRIVYTYDMGDNWEHTIELVRTMEKHYEDSPYLLEAKGSAPPEDVGGIPGFLAFREIILDPKHPNYEQARNLFGHWSPELPEYQSRPGVLPVR